MLKLIQMATLCFVHVWVGSNEELLKENANHYEKMIKQLQQETTAK